MGNQTNVTLTALAGFVMALFWWLASGLGIHAPAEIQNGSIVAAIVAIQYFAPSDFLAIFKKP